MIAFTRWINLSESVFVMNPLDSRADYRVRIFSSLRELDFAGHPTLGTCHAWIEKNHIANRNEFVQECGVGLVTVRKFADGLAFRAPPLVVSGEVDERVLRRVCAGLCLEAAGATVTSAQWVDNGAGWMVIAIDDREKLLSLKPNYAMLEGLAVGVMAPWKKDPPSTEVSYEIRAFIAGDSVPEDPATGSLVAGVAQRLALDDSTPKAYAFSQGTVLKRPCQIRVDNTSDGIWIGGATRSALRGVAYFPQSIS